MEAEVAEQPIFVLSIDVVRWAIEQLVGQRIHPFFPAYLILHRAAAERESPVDLHPRWEELEQFLHVPGGPPGKPNFRPFWHQSSSAGQHWLNANLAGSYAPSSIRELPRRVIDLEEGGGFSLKDNHWELAREHLLYDERAPAIPLAAFLYRDFGFTTDGPAISPHDLIAIFRRDFGYRPDSDDVEFSHLYNQAIPERVDWFEPLVAKLTEDA